jgi:heat shock protein HtpX
VICQASGGQEDPLPKEVEVGAAEHLAFDHLDAGVLAHELSHLAHRDVAVMTVASFLGVLAGLVMRVGFYSTMFGGRGRRDNLAVVVLGVLAVSGAVYASR